MTSSRIRQKCKNPSPEILERTEPKLIMRLGVFPVKPDKTSSKETYSDSKADKRVNVQIKPEHS
jgi:hypothetical protein